MSTTTIPTRILVNAVTFHLQVPHEPGPHSRYDTGAMGSVDRHGHVSLTPSLPWIGDGEMVGRVMDERRAAMAERMVDAGLAEWRNIGSGDTELYATSALLEHLAPALSALPIGWLDLEASDG